MRLVIFVLAIVFVAMLATLYTIENPGYVLLARAPWSIEMSLALFIPLALFTFLLLYLLIYIFVRIWRIPKDVSRWRFRKQTHIARTGLFDGLINAAEGNWAEAEAKLLASMRNSDSPLLNYLGSACASQGKGNIEKRDEYLALAHKSAPQHYLAIGMVQAFLQTQAHQYEQALATLTELRTLAPRHKPVLKLLALVYRELRDWAGLANLYPDLHKHEALSRNELDALELRTHRELLMLTLPSGSLDVLRRAWNAVPKALHRHPSLIAIYTRQLIQQDEMKEAEKLLRVAIEDQWDDSLVELYGRVRGSQPSEQLDVAESWLSGHGGNPVLLLTLARLAFFNEIEGKARNYVEKAIAVRGSADAYEFYGGLLEKLDQTDEALAAYRKGLSAYATASGAAAADTSRTFYIERRRVVR